MNIELFKKFKLFSIFFISTFALFTFAQDADQNDEVDNEELEEVDEEVITTGSRIARSPLEMAQPVTIISGEEFRIRPT